MAERTFDVVVIGAGPAGEVCAGRLAERGAAVAIVENHLVGGECSYYACIPSKALLRPEEALAEARRVPGAREAASGDLDVVRVLARRDEVITHLDDAGAVPWLTERGVEVVRGRARLDGERRVRVGDDVLVAERAVVLATGSDATLPPIPGLREANAWTNREATTAKEVPRRLVVLGGGIVGVELAQAWRTLGSEVTLIEGLTRLVAREEPFACELIEASLRERGVDVRKTARATAISIRDGDVTLELSDGSSVSGDRLLIAVGRTPRTRDLGLETVGVEAGGYVDVDDRLRAVGFEWLYAIGDVNGRVLLTHMGKYHGRIAADVILGADAAVHPLADGVVAPRVIFTDPQIAAVGHTLESAQEVGLNVRAVDHDTGGVAGGAFFGRGAAGTTRFVVDEDRRVLVGATFAGPETADFVHAATIAIVGEVPLERLWHAVPPFPTRSEVWLRLLETYGL